MPPIFFMPRRHGGWFPPPPPMPMMGCFDRMMFKLAATSMIGGMISNLGKNIAGIIRGNSSECNCNCNQLYGGYSPYYNLNSYNANFANTMYPYVNLKNNTALTDADIEGTGGTDAAVLSDMKKAYAKFGITGIYQLSDGTCFAVTKDGKTLSASSLSDLTTEISDYISENKTNPSTAKEQKVVVQANESSDEPEVEDTAAAQIAQPVADAPADTPKKREIAAVTSKFSNQFVRSEWHRYLKNPKARADEFEKVSLELGKTDSKDPHRKNPAEYALNSLIVQLGLEGVKYDSDSYKNLLADFKAMNPSLFNADGTMKKGYEKHIDKLDLPSKETLINRYNLKTKSTTSAKDTKPKAVRKYNQNMTVKLPNGSTVKRYGYEYGNGNKMYSELNSNSLDSDAVFVIAGHHYNLRRCIDGHVYDYWALNGERTAFQIENEHLIDSNGKFIPKNEFNKNGNNLRLFADTDSSVGESKNAPLNNVQIKVNEKNQVVLIFQGQEYLMDDVMAGKYNDKFS